MKFLPGPFAGNLSGAAGNLVASRGKGGAYFRMRVIPSLVQNAYTAEWRGRMASVSQAWAAISAANKESWRTYAQTNPVVDRIGQQITLQPSACFIQLNMRLLKAGGAQIDVPPVSLPPAGITGQSMTVDVGSGDTEIAWTSGALAADECLAAWVAVSDNPGRAYYKNFLKLIHVSAAAATTPEDIDTEVTARFGTPIEGARCYAEIEVWSDATGLKSGRVYAECLVTDTGP